MKELSLFFKALSEEIRLHIVQLLMPRELCVCEIMDELRLSQPAVSHHMKILKQAGLVNDRREGKWVFYSLNKDSFTLLEKILREKLIEPVSSCPSEKGRVPTQKCS